MLDHGASILSLFYKLSGCIWDESSQALTWRCARWMGVADLRELASDSLQLLTAALSSHAAQFPALFRLDVYGSIVGMFELNNLGASLCAARHSLS